MQVEKISSWQATLLLGNLFIAPLIFLESPTLVLIAARDAWLVPFVALPAGLLIVAMSSYVINKFPGKPLTEAMQLLGGNVLSTSVSLAYVAFVLLIASYRIRAVTEFIKTAILPETPMYVLIGVTAVIVAYGARQGIEVLARITELFFPVMMASLIIMPVMALPSMMFREVLPVLAEGIRPVAIAAIPTAGFYGELVVLALMASRLNRPEAAFKAGIAGLLIVASLTSYEIASMIAVSGAKEVARTNLPAYTFATLVNIAGFLRNIQPLVTTIWMGSAFTAASIFLYIGNAILAQALKLRDYKPLIIPTTFIIAALAGFDFDDSIHFLSFISLSWPVFKLPVAFLPIVLVAILALLRRP